ncbi:MAG: methyltransferase domain-containing protein [Dehalococcoidia bacterium]
MLKIIEWPLSELASQEERQHREQLGPERYSKEYLIGKWTHKKVAQHFQALIKTTGVQFSGQIVELGAGSCWLSSLLSRLDKVERVYAIELSRRRLELMAPLAFEHFGARPERIVLVAGDLNRLELADGSMDFAVASGSIHHTPDLLAAFKETWRVLKPRGKLLFFRENTKPLLRKLDEKYVKQGERWASHLDFYYTKAQYLRALQQAGFAPLELSTTPLIFSLAPPGEGSSSTGHPYGISTAGTSLILFM